MRVLPPDACGRTNTLNHLAPTLTHLAPVFLPRRLDGVDPIARALRPLGFTGSDGSFYRTLGEGILSRMLGVVSAALAAVLRWPSWHDSLGADVLPKLKPAWPWALPASPPAACIYQPQPAACAGSFYSCAEVALVPMPHSMQGHAVWSVVAKPRELVEMLEADLRPGMTARGITLPRPCASRRSADGQVQLSRLAVSGSHHVTALLRL